MQAAFLAPVSSGDCRWKDLRARPLPEPVDQPPRSIQGGLVNGGLRRRQGRSPGVELVGRGKLQRGLADPSLRFPQRRHAAGGRADERRSDAGARYRAVWAAPDRRRRMIQCGHFAVSA